MWKTIQKKVISCSALGKNHRQNELLKLKLKNDHLKLKMDWYIDQIKFLKDLIIIQETLRIATIRSNGINQQNLSATNKQ